MYTLWTDKSETLEAKIQLAGASLSNTKCRALVESTNWSFVFNGKVESDGTCLIPIGKMKGVLNEGDRGKLTLEIIADDTYFTPWTSDFEVKQSKSITVEVKEQKEQKKEGVSVQLLEVDTKTHLKNFAKALIREGIDYESFVNRKNKRRVANIVNEHLGNLPTDERKSILRKTIQLMRK